jgi:predicted ATP-grasp superfamily ATP-dependent carboligase
MSKELIFIFEFVSGGGFSRVNIPSSLFCEGFGMLRSIISDFKALGFEIHAMLDYRISSLSKFLQADIIRNVNANENYLKVFKKLVSNSKYVFIIAPETSNILYELTKIVKNYNKILVSTNLYSIKKSSSKIATYKLFKKSKVLTPRTYRIPYKKKKLDTDFIIQKLKILKCPIVIKPEDGVGAESVHYFEKKSQILNFLMKFNMSSHKVRNYILQEFIDGDDLSVSLIGSRIFEEGPIILTINSQDININGNESEYFGGYTPLENHKEITQGLYPFIKKINLLKFDGYFGIDFIRKFDNSMSFIEINPRLTTSYVGLTKIINLNCAELIFNSKFNIPIDTEIKLLYHSYFTRIDFYHEEDDNMKEIDEAIIPKLIKSIPEFVTPPIELDKSKYFSCFIATKTKDLLSSKIRANQIIQNLKNLNFKITTPEKIKLS